MKPINWSDLYKSFKNKTDYIKATTRDKLIKNKLINQSQKKYSRIDQKTIRENIKKKFNKTRSSINERVTTFTNKTETLLKTTKTGNFLLQAMQRKWMKPAILSIGGLLALKLIGKAINFRPTPAIPEQYERGYDMIEENLTDFGSPLHLLKAASKTITPYYSSIRKNIVTTTDTIMNNNLSLYLSKNAIKHTRY